MESPLDPRPGQAIYTKLTLSLYDPLVLGLSNRIAWRCPSHYIQHLYDQYVSPSHLEIGVGTGYFLEYCVPRQPVNDLVLFDLNRHCLQQTAERLQRFNPRIYRANVLEPFQGLDTRFESVGINYVLHCLPGTPRQKGIVFDHIKTHLKDDGVCFGATIVNREADNLFSKTLKSLYNRRGIFCNRDDTAEAIESELRQRFVEVESRLIGTVFLFRARKAAAQENELPQKPKRSSRSQ